jgi:hypothetical protein
VVEKEQLRTCFQEHLHRVKTDPSTGRKPTSDLLKHQFWNEDDSGDEFGEFDQLKQVSSDLT